MGAVNVLELKETRQGRTMIARFTDRAVDRIGAPLAALIADRRIAPTSTADPVDVAVETVEATTVHSSLVGQPGGPRPQTADAKRQLQKASDLDRLKEVFRIEGERVYLDLTDLKASSKRDFARRLTFLFLYTKEELGSEMAARSELNEILEDAVLNDGNIRSWLANEANIRWNPEAGTLGLRSPAREEAVRYLDEVLDTSVQGSYRLGGSPKPRQRKSGGDGAEPTERKSGASHARGPSKKAGPWLSKWEDRRAEIGYDKSRIHKILNDAPRAQAGMVGLWAIRLATADETKAVSTYDLSSFLWHAFEIRIERRNLEAALKSNQARGRVQHISGSVFQILPSGLDAVEALVAAAVARFTNPAGKSRQKK